MASVGVVTRQQTKQLVVKYSGFVGGEVEWGAGRLAEEVHAKSAVR
jgi:hypothetical protein